MNDTRVRKPIDHNEIRLGRIVTAFSSSTMNRQGPRHSLYYSIPYSTKIPTCLPTCFKEKKNKNFNYQFHFANLHLRSVRCAYHVPIVIGRYY